MNNRVGLRAPAWRGGCGKAALARLPPAEVEARVRRLCGEEGIPPPDLAALHAELEIGRGQDYLVSSSFQAGRTSVAAAVVGDDGPVGGMSVAGPSALFTPAAIRRIGPDVAQAASRAGAQLGRR
jgi:DNA-binding IclR family transcriptional regulator